jgi:hypothetical protein
MTQAFVQCLEEAPQQVCPSLGNRHALIESTVAQSYQHLLEAILCVCAHQGRSLPNLLTSPGQNNVQNVEGTPDTTGECIYWLLRCCLRACPAVYGSKIGGYSTITGVRVPRSHSSCCRIERKCLRSNCGSGWMLSRALSCGMNAKLWAGSSLKMRFSNLDSSTTLGHSNLSGSPLSQPH